MPIRVLLVEDNVDHAYIAHRGLSASGDFEVTHVRTGNDALEAAARDPFDACVVDYRLPDWEGIGLTQELRRRAFQGRLLLVSSTKSEALAARAVEAGIDGYVVKSTGFADRIAGALLARERGRPA